MSFRGFPCFYVGCSGFNGAVSFPAFCLLGQALIQASFCCQSPVCPLLGKVSLSLTVVCPKIVTNCPQVSSPPFLSCPLQVSPHTTITLVCCKTTAASEMGLCGQNLIDTLHLCIFCTTVKSASFEVRNLTGGNTCDTPHCSNTKQNLPVG